MKVVIWGIYIGYQFSRVCTNSAVLNGLCCCIYCVYKMN